MRHRTRVVQATRPGLAGAAGLLLAATFGVVAVVRRDRPLHAYGSTCRGVLEVVSPAGVGVPLLDSPGRHDVLLRASRAMSVSHRGADIMGLALRLPDDGGDLLLASTGTSVLGRYVLRLHTRLDAGPLTTLLPARTSTGLVQLALRPDGVGAWTLLWSRPSHRRWMPVGSLVASPDEALPEPGHFDPTGHPPAGLTPPPWVRSVRDPAYRTARALVRLTSPSHPAHQEARP